MLFLPFEQDRNERVKRNIKHKIEKVTGDSDRILNEYEWDIAISFAGTEHHFAENLATSVRDAGFVVFMMVSILKNFGGWIFQFFLMKSTGGNLDIAWYLFPKITSKVCGQTTKERALRPEL